MSDLSVAPADPGLLALADQCVMCGLCLPQCPTYGLERHEAESPRGRIALARQLAKGIPLPPTAVAHLDHCLACLSCQKACPSQVRYGEILETVRARLAPARQRRPWRGLTPARLTRLLRIGTAVGVGRWLPHLARWLPTMSPWRRLAAEMPLAPPALPHLAPSATTSGKEPVTLFPGCVARVLDRDTLEAARVLLEALGHRVDMPAAAVCCGALPRHAGEAEVAQAVEDATRKALAALPSTRVLACASGCLGGLRGHVLAGTRLAVDDVAAFIARDPALATLRFRPLPARVALHVPCTQASVGDGGHATRALLARIPGLELLRLPDQPRCCGAAGTHFLEFPADADRLRDDKLAQVAATAPAMLLTSNVGCRAFLDNGLRQRGAALPVLHPLALLARQLETARP